jgi:hypothetical protein
VSQPPPPAPPREPEPSHPELELADDAEESAPFKGGSGIYGLASEAESLTTESMQQSEVSQRMCPHCGEGMPVTARLCTSCGYDIQTGRVPERTSVKMGGALGNVLGAAGSALGGMALGAGRFLLGTCLSAVGAMIGAAIWAGIGIATGFEIGYVAWAVGGLAGLGMYLGYREQNFKAGLVAAGMAVGGILAAKVLIFVFLFASLASALVTGQTDSVELQRTLIQGEVAEQCLKEKNLTLETASEKQREAAWKEAERRVKNMSDAQVRQEWEKFKKSGEERLAQAARSELARFHAEKQANHQGLAFNDEKRRSILREQQRRFESMSKEQVDKAAAERATWEESGKWQDKDYVRDCLIYAYVDEAVSKDADSQNKRADAFKDAMTPQEWKKYYTAAASRVDAMSADDRLAEAKNIEEEGEEDTGESAAAGGGHKASGDSEDAGGGGSGGISGFFGSGLFGGMDILFFLLAVATAFRIASGGLSRD